MGGFRDDDVDDDIDDGGRGLREGYGWTYLYNSLYAYTNPNGWIYTIVTANTDVPVETLREDLEAFASIEMVGCSSERSTCNAYVLYRELRNVYRLPSVRYHKAYFYRIIDLLRSQTPAPTPVHEEEDGCGRRRVQEDSEPFPPRSGPVKSQAVEALQLDKLRAKRPELTGAGMKIGVISNSFNSLGGYDADVESGDLPSDVVVLEEAPFPMRDDGRAMLQLIHDIAPDAMLYFHTAAFGPDDFFPNDGFVRAIERMVEEGVDVIVDDALSRFDPWFQEGRVAQAANDAAEIAGIPYFAAAGNSGRDSWEGAYSGIPCNGVTDREYLSCHDFGGGKTSQSITVDDDVVLSLQWDDLWISVNNSTGAATDIDALVFDPVSGELVFAQEYPNIGDIADEQIYLPPGTWDLVLAHVDGPEPTLVKWINFDDMISLVADPPVNSGTLVGQANSPYVAAVGATFELQPFSKLDLEPSSSAGGVPLLIERDGSRKAEPLVTDQPRFVGPEGSFNTFFGPFFEDPRPGFEGNHRYFGTSAAAPNVAAVALLMLQANPNLSPTRVYELMEQTAIDMGEVGFDYDSGHGFVNGYAAVELALAEGRGVTEDTKPQRWKRLSRKFDRSTCAYTLEDKLLAASETSEFTTKDAALKSLMFTDAVHEVYGIGTNNGNGKKVGHEKHVGYAEDELEDDSDSSFDDFSEDD